MSKTTKRKHVTREVLDEFALPEGNQQIVKICASKGNNLHEVITPNQEKFLVSMPTKFRKNVWIKRGDFVIIEPIEEGCKVKAEIIRILYREQMKYIQKEGQWPKEFSDKQKEDNNDQATQPHNGVDDDDNQVTKPCNGMDNDYDDDEEEEEEDDSDLFINTNHPTVVYYSDSSSDEPEQDGDDDADNESR